MSQDILQKYHIRAKKALGQNFLVDEYKVSAIARSISVSGENIIEVWPWYGALTEMLLAQQPAALHLVELDTDMVDILHKRITAWELDTSGIQFDIEQTDILKYQPNFSDYNVIANIPYYITSPILRHFLYSVENTPKNMVILMQQDVWDKILWNKKNKSSVLSLFIEKKCHVSEVLKVSKESFIPAPKVESSVLLFESHDVYQGTDDYSFLEHIKKWFAEPRKLLVKNLVKGGYEKENIIQILNHMWISDMSRPEDLNISQWIELSNNL